MARKPSPLQRDFYSFVLHGETERAQALILLMDPSSLNYALGLAAYEGHEDLLDALLPYCDPSDSDYRALLLAAMNGRTEMVRRLLPFGLHTRAISEAARYGHAEVVDLLCAQATQKQITQARGVAKRMKWTGNGVQHLMDWEQR